MTLSCGDDDLHVWTIDLAVGATALDGLRSVLSCDELERADRFYSEIDRSRFVAARGSLRNILSLYTGVDAAAITFDYGDFGKPTLARGSGGDSDIQFNLSHSCDVALCAIARGREVGIDVEEIRQDVSVERVAAQFFLPAERRLLATVANSAETFTRIWVRKEAYLKATGRGIGADLRGLPDMSAKTDGNGIITVIERGASWAIQDVPASSGYCAAVATPGPARVLNRRYAATLPEF